MVKTVQKTGKKTAGRRGGIQTRARALELVAIRRARGIKGGRPKGVLNASTIAAIKSREAFEQEAINQLGRVLNNLLVGSDLQDTAASKELLERTLGKVRQDLNVTGGLSIKALHLHALADGVPLTADGQPATQSDGGQLHSLHSQEADTTPAP